MSEDSVLYESNLLAEERAEEERLLEGIRWQYYRGAGAQSPSIDIFYWYDCHDVPNPEFWAETERIFTRLARRASQQRERIGENKRRRILRRD